MHRVIPFVVSMGLLLAPLAARAQAPTIQFKRGDLRVGSANVTENAVDLRLALDLRAKDMAEPLKVAVSASSTQRYTTTVLAAKGQVAHKVRVAFDDVVEVSQQQGESQRKVSPVSGKTYVAELRKEGLTITQASGKPVPEGEQAEVKKSLPKLGKPDEMAAAFPSTPMAVGATLDGFSDALARQLVDDSSEKTTRVTEARAKLVEIRQESHGLAGVFDVSMSLSREDASTPIVTTIPLKGQMTVLAKGVRLLDLTLSGPVAVALTEDAVEHGFQGKGDGEMRLRTGIRAADTPR
ncbi:hypothetical protein A176_006141 [Myxococcus hansupus]|uniref:Uncharacterized protein n=1 Tax=Pseudomyxococcus hansupus TaxID=1297742 RepID=A0A0H4X262_9BACT|nr:hypothetical protein [Myxococcus hansupus]AKQ69229.1 hypothetical protein A176_006141 [Myxococcus hansupus]